MTKVNLYRYVEEIGEVIITPNKRKRTDKAALYRLIADDGKLLIKDGYEPTPCIDTEDITGWGEIDDPTHEESEQGDEL